MKIDIEKYKEAYECGRRVYAGSMRLTDAIKHLTQVGINRNSAGDLVQNLRHLINGECYTRNLSIAVTDDYLTWITRDYGPEYLRKAISAIEQHVRYYEDLTGAKMPGHTRIAEKHRAILDAKQSLIPGEEVIPKKMRREGHARAILVNVYERSASARRDCINRYGYFCSVCGFDFERAYGVHGKDYIHVHHLIPLSELGREYVVDPIKDLRPVCPNCHAMIHRDGGLLGIDALRNLLVVSQTISDGAGDV